ncbi:MAG: AsmA family protein [Alphaproteobacteria bacterium]|nr:AsmA family protein [Alphaproteobacteria bacterium]
MRFKWVLLIFFIIIIMMVGGVFVFLYSINMEQVRTFVQDEIKKQTGRDLIIEGEIEWVLSLSPTIEIHNVKLLNPSDFSSSEMASINLFRLKLNLLPLIHKQIVINSLILNKSNVLFEKNSKGQKNWDFDFKKEDISNAPENEKSNFTFAIEKIDIQDLKLTYKDNVNKKEESIYVKKIIGYSPNTTSPVNLDLELNINKIPITIIGTIGPLSSFVENKLVEIDIKSFINKTEIKINGTINNPQLFNGVDINLSVHANNLNDLLSLASIENMQPMPIDIKVKLSDSNGVLNLNPFEIHLDDMNLLGKIAILNQDTKPKIEGEIKVTKIDLNKIIAKKSKENKLQPVTSLQEIIPDDPINFSFLTTIDTKIQLFINQILYSSQKFKDVEAIINLSNGHLRVHPLKIYADKGHIDMNLSLEEKRSKAFLTYGLDVENINTSFLSELIQTPDLLRNGWLNIKANLKGEGNTAKSILSALDGNINLYIDKGDIQNAFLKILLEDLIKLAVTGESETSPINCIAGHFDVTKGLIQTKAIAFDTDTIIIIANGHINLPKEQINMHIESSSKKAILMNVAIPMNVAGPLSKPEIFPDPVRTPIDLAGKVVKGAALGMEGILATLGIQSGELKSLEATPPQICQKALNLSKESNEPTPKINPIENNDNQ